MSAPTHPEAPLPGAIAERMREDWNRRAREDAGYYVAFGRRKQSREEFFATAHDQVRGFERELKRLPEAAPQSRRALEIGCGPGRLMLPLSRHFGEIHGVDISEEMIELARRNLAAVRNAHPRHAPNSNLEAFASDSFDFVYSYAVFQHIPDREVVTGYLKEAQRVLKPGGILRCQINGLPEQAPQYDTWSGVRISYRDVRAFAREQGLELLALEGIETQYMWATFRKPAAAVERAGSVRVRRITNAHSSEPAAPARGRFAALSLWVDGLPEAADLNRLEVTIGGKPAYASYLGQPEHDGLQQLNVYVPGGLEAGLQPVEVEVNGEAAASSFVRLIPPPPAVPRVVSLTDGIDLLSGNRIVTGSVKISLEEVYEPGQLRLRIGKAEVEVFESFCTDPRVPSWEVNFEVPEGVEKGETDVRVELGGRFLGTYPVEVLG
ncbi:MAG: methyltransferase domain-containing protein [Acidimicrobiia bacterium]|nr:methyltransferase domain-containing protein [Acidimicrobiia bacterium]